jgi:hypothetical protein
VCLGQSTLVTLVFPMRAALKSLALPVRLTSARAVAVAAVAASAVRTNPVLSVVPS